MTGNSATRRPPRLHIGRTFLVGLAFLTICAFWQLYDQVVPLMLTTTFAFSDAQAGIIMSFDNVAALILLPLSGILSDQTRTRIGRRMPYIVVGTLLSAMLMILLPYADWTDNLPLFMIVLVLLILSMSLYRVPAVALMPDITPKPLRSQANAIISFMGALGGSAAMGVIIWRLQPAGTFRADYMGTFIIIAAMMVLELIVLLSTIPENQLHRQMEATHYGVDPFTEEVGRVDVRGRERLSPALRRSLLGLLGAVACWYFGYNAVASGYSRYAIAVWGQDVSASSLSLLIANTAALLSFIPAGFLSRRIGRKLRPFPN